MEVLLVLFDYLKTRGIRGLLFEIFLPVIVTTVLIYHLEDSSFSKEHYQNVISNFLTLIGILLGFTISTFTVMITIDNQNVASAKLEMMEPGCLKAKDTVYNKALYSLGYLIFMQGVSLIYCFVFASFAEVSNHSYHLFICLLAVSHIIMVLMRSVLDLYFVLTKKK